MSHHVYIDTGTCHARWTLFPFGPIFQSQTPHVVLTSMLAILLYDATAKEDLIFVHQQNMMYIKTPTAHKIAQHQQ